MNQYIFRAKQATETGSFEEFDASDFMGSFKKGQYLLLELDGTFTPVGSPNDATVFTDEEVQKFNINGVYYEDDSPDTYLFEDFFEPVRVKLFKVEIA
jgi:hypothetical protein